MRRIRVKVGQQAGWHGFHPFVRPTSVGSLDRWIVGSLDRWTVGLLGVDWHIRCEPGPAEPADRHQADRPDCIRHRSVVAYGRAVCRLRVCRHAAPHGSIRCAPRERVSRYLSCSSRGRGARRRQEDLYRCDGERFRRSPALARRRATASRFPERSPKSAMAHGCDDGVGSRNPCRRRRGQRRSRPLTSRS